MRPGLQGQQLNGGALGNRTVQGVQIHHSADLARAYGNAHKTCSGLESAIVKSDDPRLLELRDQVITVIRAIGRYEEQVRARVDELKSTDPNWNLYVDGDLPYPDERKDGLTPRCRCYDRCLWHDVLNREGPPTPGTICNCSVLCYQHRVLRRGSPNNPTFEPLGGSNG